MGVLRQEVKSEIINWLHRGVSIYMNTTLSGLSYYRWALDAAADEKQGSLLRMAARRFLSDLEREDLVFRAESVDRCLRFLRILKHYKGSSAGRGFEPEPWQEFIVANILGFYRVDTGTRRFTRAYIEISRKNGKSFLVNALAMYFLLCDGEASPEVIVGANSREQANGVDFEMCNEFARQLDPKSRGIKRYRGELKVPKTTGRLKVISSDTKTNDGYNPSVGIIDEYHAAPTSALRDIIASGMGMRKNPLLFVITTAGFNKDYPCYKLRETCCDVLRGVKEDDGLFATIFSLDEGDDWRDEDVWHKANPNLGVTVTMKGLRDQVRGAMNNVAEEVGVRTKNLNQWCDAARVWIPDAKILSCMRNRSRDELMGRVCFVGVDLSAVSDLTAVSYMFPATEENPMYFYTNYYLPESALVDKFNKTIYKDWAMRGILTLTPGNVTDYDWITNDIKKAYDRYEIMAIGYDKWNATQWAIDMTDLGMPLEEFGQNLGRFTGPTKELERLILSESVEIEFSEITRFCFRNVSIKEDWNENRKPVKSSPEKKIDGVVSMLQALGVSMGDKYMGMN